MTGVRRRFPVSGQDQSLGPSICLLHNRHSALAPGLTSWRTIVATAGQLLTDHLSGALLSIPTSDLEYIHPTIRSLSSTQTSNSPVHGFIASHWATNV